jgi:hypothetical protein
LSALEKKTDWVYRIFDRRPVAVKTKNSQLRKIAAIDTATGIPFSLDVPNTVSMDDADVGKSYLVSLKVYTASNIDSVASDYIEFFKNLDVDQSIDDFIKAYWSYPKHIKFELIEVGPL